MGRLPRVYIEGILYYVTSRSGHNQNLFIDFLDYQKYISLIDKYKRQYGFKLFAFVLLPTHLHILIELKNNVPISNIMHDLNSLYTKIFNGRYKKRGHLFQERFRTVLAEKETYLLPLVRHIILNPQRLNLVEHPQDYPYSSYAQILAPEKRKSPDISEEIEEIFTQLQGREPAFDAYISNIDRKQINEFKKRLHKTRILGSPDFIEKIKKTIEESIKAQKKAKPWSQKMRIMVVAIAGTIIFFTTITIDYFYRRSLKLRTKYDRTLARYQNTLEMLIRERDAALKAKEDIEKYQWKIALTEKALEELQEERRLTLLAKKEIEGYAWRIMLTQIGGPQTPFSNTDIIYFQDNHFSSVNMGKKGFTSSHYSKSELKGDKVAWETMQSSPQGGSASWRGEWDGNKNQMNGVFSWRSTDGAVRDFSFVSIGERMKR